MRHEEYLALVEERFRFDDMSEITPAAEWIWEELELGAVFAELAAFRKAVRDGVGPSCEDVCLRECLGVCGG